MNLLAITLAITILFTPVTNSPPSWVSCSSAASALNGIVSPKYQCVQEDPVSAVDNTVLYAFTYKNMAYSGVVSIDLHKKKKTDIEPAVYKAVGDADNIAKFYGKKSKKLTNPDDQVIDDIDFVAIESAPYGILDDFYEKYKVKFNDPRFVLQITLDIARGLGELHQSGWVHTTLSPQTVVVCENFVAKIIGLSQASDINKPAKLIRDPKFTDTRIVNKISDECDGKTDIYSLGVIAYKLWNGRLPYEAQEIEEMKIAILIGSMKEFTRQPERTVAEVIMGCLATDDGNRLSIDELISKIDNYLKSDNDVYIKKTRFCAKSDVDQSGEVVVKKVDRKTAAASYKAGNRYRRLALAEELRPASENTPKSASLLPLVWGLSAVLMFLVFWAISSWVDRLRRGRSKQEGKVDSEARSSAGLVFSDLNVAFHS